MTNVTILYVPGYERVAEKAIEKIRRALRILLWLKGSDGVSDEEIQQCVREQMRYLDFVLLSESLDVAHERWASRRAWT